MWYKLECVFLIPIQYNKPKKKKNVEEKNAIHIQDTSNYKSHQVPT